MIITNNMLGECIRTLHGLIPYIIVIIVVYGNKTINKFTIIFVIIMLELFIYHGKCFISIYEKKLLNDGVNVVDIYLKLFNLNVNSFNRKYVSIYGIIFLLIFIIIMYYYRHC